jgi:hypothetical protein
MSDVEGREEVDYEEDVDRLKKVWEEIKVPKGKVAKESLVKTQAGTQTKLANPISQQSKPSKDKKNKVIVSDNNIKETIRNPKIKSPAVIEVITRPPNNLSQMMGNRQDVSAPEHLFLSNP